MEQSIQILIVLLSGLIAKETTVLLENVSARRKSALSETIQYLIYSVFSFVKGKPDRGVFTSYIPDGKPGHYYQEQLQENTKHD